jgi:hypothetical protein
MRLHIVSVALRAPILALAALFVLLSGVPAHADAQPPDYAAAKRHFLSGKQRFDRHEYAEAAREFQAAYEITKDPVVLFNVAEALEKAGAVDEAVRAYEGYLAGIPQAQDREAVERKITDLKARKAPPPPPPAPSNPVPNPPPLSGAAENPVPPAGAGGEEAPASRLRVLAWVGVGLTAALAVTAGMLALAAQSREDDISRLQHFVDPMTGQPLDFNTGDTAQRYRDLQDEGSTYSDLAIGFALASGAAAIGTAVLFIVDAQAPSSRAQAPSRLSFGAAALPGGAHVSLGWRF